MFNNPPRIFAHTAAVEKGNFVTTDYILNKDTDSINLFHRFCPHRRYPLAEPGNIITDITCKFHNFKWTEHGIPINNDKKLNCGNAQIGRSGLVIKNFLEPNHKWVDDLSAETNLVYSHSYQGESTGSYLWLMDAEADLLHVYTQGIHPFLAQQINIEDIVMEQGDGWILQNHPSGWWLYVFPFTFVEYGNPGMVMVNTVTPHNNDNEYGFNWITQFYYDPSTTFDRRLVFETLETVFKEDVAAAELQKGNYFPLRKAMNRYEDHCVHFGNWVTENKNDRTEKK
jgi:hypothetical protein